MAKLDTLQNVARAVATFRREGKVTIVTQSSAMRRLVSNRITARCTSDFHTIVMGDQVQFLQHPETRNAPLLKPDFR